MFPIIGNIGFTRGISPVPVPNQTTSKTAFVPFTDAINNDWQGRLYTILTAAGYWMGVWVEGTNHSDYNSASHYVNIFFSNDEGATWSDNNEYIGGAAVTGFPLVPPGGSSTGFVDFTIIRCPNDDLVIIAQDRGVNGSAWNGVNFTQHQYRSTDDGQTWTYEFDFCAAIGLVTVADKAKIQGLFENMVVGNDVYITLCQIRADLDDTRISLYKSSDNCATWSLVSHPIAYDELSPDATASAIAHLGNGKFFCVFRTQDLGAAYQRTSNDYGLTWGTLSEFSSFVGYVGVHDPKVKGYSNLFLLYGRDNKKILGDPTAALFMRNSWWTTTDLFTSPSNRYYLDPFYAGNGTANQGDAGYTRAMQKSDGTFMFFGYYGTNFAALLYKYDVSHTNSPSTERYANNAFFPETLTTTGIRLQLNRDNIVPSGAAPSVGIAVFATAIQTLGTGAITWAVGGTAPELVIQDDRGWAYMNSSRFVSPTSIQNTFFRNSFSFAFWLDPDDGQPAAAQRIWMAASDVLTTAPDQVFAQLTTTGTLLIRYIANSVTVSFVTGSAVFADGAVAARHIAVTVTSGGFMVVYIDGVSVASDGSSTGDMSTVTMTNYSSTLAFFIGMRQTNTSTFDLPFVGKIREFIIQPVVWTVGEVASIMSN